MSRTSRDSGDPMRVSLNIPNVWRVGFVLLAVAAVAAFLLFVVDDGGSVLFTILMSWFAAITMEPAVGRLARHMPRGVATGLVMATAVVIVVLFLAAFGRLLLDQIGQLLHTLPALLNAGIEWVNQRFGTAYNVPDILSSLNITQEQVAGYAVQVAGGLLGLVGTVVGGVFSLFTFGLFTFYLSADGPRFKQYIASLFPRRAQGVVTDVWNVTSEKTGGYVAARVILASINGTLSALVFLLIGMPYALALGLWTGVVAQFIPTIGTYIAVAFPVVVGLLSPNPWVGVFALIWGLLYQQVENLTIEPRISGKAVAVHPAVAFGSVLLGAALFGVAGALLAVPVTAMLLSLLDIYGARHHVDPTAGLTGKGQSPTQDPDGDATPAEPAPSSTIGAAREPGPPGGPNQPSPRES